MTLVIIRKKFDYFLSIFARILVFCMDFNILYSRNICFVREELLYIKAGCIFVFVDFVYSSFYHWIERFSLLNSSVSISRKGYWWIHFTPALLTSIQQWTFFQNWALRKLHLWSFFATIRKKYINLLYFCKKLSKKRAWLYICDSTKLMKSDYIRRDLHFFAIVNNTAPLSILVFLLAV